MDVFDNSRLEMIVDDEGRSYSVFSSTSLGEARFLFGSASNRGGGRIFAVEIDAEDAGRLLECLKAKNWEDRFETTAGEIHLTASRRNSGDPYSEGFDIEVQEIKAGNDWGERVFGGYFEDGHYLDNIKEVLQHCVDLDQKLKAAPTP